MFTLCYYAAVILPLNVYHAAINLSRHYVDIIRLLLFAGYTLYPNLSHEVIGYDVTRVSHIGEHALHRYVIVDQ